MNYRFSHRRNYLAPMNTTSHSRTRSTKFLTPRSVALALLATLTVVILSGCRSNNPTTTSVDPTGIYQLTEVDGKAVPCETRHGDTPMTIHSGVFTINADGTCASLMKFSVRGHQEVGREVKATYILTGADLTMKWEGAGTTRGTVEGNTFTMINEGMKLSYQRPPADQ